MSIERLPVSLLISTRNEEEGIVAAIESCKEWVSEVVVVDMESSDRTVELARGCGAKVVELPAAGIAEPGRQVGIDAASQPWVFVLDVDERPGERLPEQVARQITRSDLGGVRFARENRMMGRPVKHSNWWPDWQLRLFRREGANWPRHVHTRVKTSGPVEDAPMQRDCSIIHLTDRTVAEHLSTMARYARFDAIRYQEIGRRPSAVRMVLAPPARFAEAFFLHKGFLDGMRGLVIACLMACYAAMVETQLWDHTKRG